MFKITNGKGFHITFKNGYTVSVQLGYGNYCDNKSYDELQSGETYSDAEIMAGKTGCNNAEIAIWGPDKEMIEFPGWGDTVKGYCSPDEVLTYLNWASNQK